MIYDCFTFFNEFELLELRLRELDNLVDKFVLVESTKTHPGHPKPLHFAQNRERYSAYADKIIHVVVDDMPGGDEPRDHWVRERFQRNAIGRGLVNCRPDDIIMVSDLDEIPNVATVKRLVANMPFQDDLLSSTLHAALNSRLIRRIFSRGALRHILRKNNPFVWRLEQHPCCYFLNLRSGDGNYWWYGTKIAHYRDMYSAEEMRYSGHKTVKDGGWHFSYMGGADRIKAKVAATAHQEINNPESIKGLLSQTTMESVAQELALGNLELIPVEKLPNFIRALPQHLSSWVINPAQLPRDRVKSGVPASSA
jgi:hypothetical protein